MCHTHPSVLIQHAARRIVNSSALSSPANRTCVCTGAAGQRQDSSHPWTGQNYRGAGGGYQGGCGAWVGVAVISEDINGVALVHGHTGVKSLCLSLLQVYLEARKQEQQKHQQSLKMLSDEVSQIQEVSLWTVSAALTVSLTHRHTPALLSLHYVTVCMIALCKFLLSLYALLIVW